MTTTRTSEPIIAEAPKEHDWLEAPPGQGCNAVCRICGVKSHRREIADLPCRGFEIPHVAEVDHHEYDPYE